MLKSLQLIREDEEISPVSDVFEVSRFMHELSLHGSKDFYMEGFENFFLDETKKCYKVNLYFCLQLASN